MPAIADLSLANWHRLNRLLEAALALEDDARSAWLRDLPASEADLAPLLQRLLSSKDLNETAQFATAPPLRMDGENRGAEEQAGQLFGPYRLVRELGRGGMGTVWLAARADGAFERQVALKLPRAEWTDRGLAQRFARERAMLASVNHPNIAQLFDAGWSESGRPYLALEYVEGQSILDWCKQRQLDIASRLAVFIAVIRAVAHAHARLIVHRDLKPSNVLVTAEGKVKLLDFGIAKLLAAETVAAEETELTRIAGRALTPSYAAPEQILGHAISTATDIYALGVLLFELLTGERPYRLGRDALQRRSALEEAIVRVDAPAPSAVAKDKAGRRALRGDLDAIVLKALKKASEHRYETAAAFADDIERYLNRLPVRAQRTSLAYRFRRFILRNRLAVSAVAGIILALALGLLAVLWQAKAARNEAVRANTIKNFVLSIIEQADPVASRQTKEADIALLAAAESRIDGELGAQPELALQMRRAIATAYVNRGEFQRAREVLREGIEKARPVLASDNLELLGAQVQIAQEWMIGGPKEREDLDAAIATLRRLGADGKLLLADAMFARHSISHWFARPEEIIQAARDALGAARDSGDEGKGMLAANALAKTLLDWSRDAEALDIIANAYQRGIGSGKLDPSDPRVIIAMSWHGMALSANGQGEAGLKLVEEAVAAARARHGSNANVTEVTLQNLSEIHWGDPKRALGPMREAYEISLKRDPPDSMNRRYRRSHLANVLLALDQVDELERLLEETPMPKGAVGPGTTVWQLHYRIEEARMREALGDSVAAERLLVDIVPQLEQLGIPAMAGHTHLILVNALLQNGKAEEAEKVALEMLEHLRSGQGCGVPCGLVTLGETRFMLGNYQSAVELVDQVTTQFWPGPPVNRAGWRAQFVRGRALLKLGNHQEALKILAGFDSFWQESGPEHVYAARARYWHGQALIANGETARGRGLVQAALPRLAGSRFALDRELAKQAGYPTKKAKDAAPEPSASAR